jgi:hypothetical protein
MQLKPIARNINIINSLLMTVVALFVLYNFSPLTEMKVKYALPSVKKVAEKKEKITVETQTLYAAEYMKITDDNLFHPERRIPPEKKEEPPPPPKPEFVLYGTLISDDLSIAYLEDLKAPRSTPGRGKRVTPLKKGASMSGFTLREINPEQVVMYRGEEKLVVLVNDPSRHKERKEAGLAAASPVQPAGTGQTSAKVTQPSRERAKAQRAQEEKKKERHN